MNSWKLIEGRQTIRRSDGLLLNIEGDDTVEAYLAATLAWFEHGIEPTWAKQLERDGPFSMRVGHTTLSVAYLGKEGAGRKESEEHNYNQTITCGQIVHRALHDRSRLNEIIR